MDLIPHRMKAANFAFVPHRFCGKVAGMLIPQNRLLLAVGALVVPLAAAAGLLPPPLAEAALAGIGAALAAATMDAAWSAARGARGVEFTLPEVVRLSKGRPGTVPVVVRNAWPGLPARRLRAGPGWPEAVHTPVPELTLTLERGVERTRFDWPCTGLQRGRYGVGHVYYEEASPLGLWAVRRSAGVAGELRVYPDLRAERRAAAAFLHRGSLGSHAQRQVGRGREFEKLRDYVPGDSIEDISWKATARRQRPVSKTFQIERTQEIYVVVDASRLGARPARLPAGDGGSGAEGERVGEGNGARVEAVPTVLERYLSSALLLCLAAERQGDLFGLTTFAEGVKNFLRAKNGAAHFDACREAIYALEPTPVSPDFDELCTFLRLRLRRRALLVVLTSSLDDPALAEGFIKAVERVSRQHVVLVNSLRPAGVAPLFDDADRGAAVRTTEHVYQRLGGHLRWQTLQETENRLRRLGVGFHLLDESKMTEQLVTQYINVKRRQVI